MAPIGSYDMVVIVALASFAIQIGGLVALPLIGRWSSRELAAMVAECQRLTRAVGGVLVIQEEEKTRELFRQQPS